jgi:hypothetical protein
MDGDEINVYKAVMIPLSKVIPARNVPNKDLVRAVGKIPPRLGKHLPRPIRNMSANQKVASVFSTIGDRRSALIFYTKSFQYYQLHRKKKVVPSSSITRRNGNSLNAFQKLIRLFRLTRRQLFDRSTKKSSLLIALEEAYLYSSIGESLRMLRLTEQARVWGSKSLYFAALNGSSRMRYICFMAVGDIELSGGNFNQAHKAFLEAREIALLEPDWPDSMVEVCTNAMMRAKHAERAELDR